MKFKVRGLLISLEKQFSFSFFLKKIYLFLFYIYTCFASTVICTPRVQYLQPAEGVRTPEPGITYGCELP